MLESYDELDVYGKPMVRRPYFSVEIFVAKAVISPHKSGLNNEMVILFTDRHTRIENRQRSTVLKWYRQLDAVRRPCYS